MYPNLQVCLHVEVKHLNTQVNSNIITEYPQPPLKLTRATHPSTLENKTLILVLKHEFRTLYPDFPMLALM